MQLHILIKLGRLINISVTTSETGQIVNMGRWVPFGTDEDDDGRDTIYSR